MSESPDILALSPSRKFAIPIQENVVSLGTTEYKTPGRKTKRKEFELRLDPTTKKHKLTSIVLDESEDDSDLDHGSEDPDRSRYIFYPDPFQSSTWIKGPTETMQELVNQQMGGGLSDDVCGGIRREETINESKDGRNAVFTVNREYMMNNVLTEEGRPVSMASMFKNVPWVVKELHAFNPLDVNDSSYSAVRAQLLACFTSEDFGKYTHNGEKDVGFPYSRNILPILFHWQCVYELNGKLLSNVYMAMPKGDMTMTQYIAKLFAHAELTESILNTACTSIADMIVQVMRGLTALQTPELMMNHNDLHTGNVMIFLPGNPYYEKRAPGRLVVGNWGENINPSNDDPKGLISLSIRSKKKPWCNIYDFDFATSARWKALRNKDVSPITSWIDIFRFISSVRNVINKVCKPHEASLSRGSPSLTRLDEALFTATRGRTLNMEKRSIVLLSTYPEQQLIGSTMDMQKLQKQLGRPRSIVYEGQTINPRNAIFAIARAKISSVTTEMGFEEHPMQEIRITSSGVEYSTPTQLPNDYIDPDTMLPFVSPDDAYAEPTIVNGERVRVSKRLFYDTAKITHSI